MDIVQTGQYNLFGTSQDFKLFSPVSLAKISQLARFAFGGDRLGSQEPQINKCFSDSYHTYEGPITLETKL